MFYDHFNNIMKKKKQQFSFLPVNPRTHTGTRVGCLRWYRSYPFSLHPYCLCCLTSQTSNSTQAKQTHKQKQGMNYSFIIIKYTCKMYRKNKHINKICDSWGKKNNKNWEWWWEKKISHIMTQVFKECSWNNYFH